MRPTPLTLLCGTDFSESGDVACEAALGLAVRLRARVLLAHVVPPSSAAVVLDDPDFGPFNRELARKAAEAESAVRTAMDRKLRALATRFTGAGVGVVTRLLDGRPADALRQAAIEAGAAMIVVGTHGRTPPVSWFIGSVAERIVRESEVPVLVVRDRQGARIRSWADRAHRLHVAVGCSPDEESENAVVLAKVLAKGSNSEPIFGRATDSLAADAEGHDADLLVLGTRGLRGTERKAEESFAVAALRRAEIPVLCVPQNSDLSAWMVERDHIGFAPFQENR